MQISLSTQVKATTTVNASIDSCFDYTVPVPLAHIFKRYAFIPGVARTDETEHWSKPGLTRTVYFADGTTAKESLTSVTRPGCFSYRISGFTGINRVLIDHIEGEWNFTRDAGGSATRIDWTYTIFAQNIPCRIIIASIFAPMVGQLLFRALLILKSDLEQTPQL